MARLIYQHPSSPYNLARRPGQPLPLLRFADSCPVYFDRHTLSIKPGQLSLYTMDGRMRFELSLEPGQLALFERAKLREVVLSERLDHTFELTFQLEAPEATVEPTQQLGTDANEAPDLPEGELAPIPEYVSVEVAP
jgi:hypothetical protein